MGPKAPLLPPKPSTESEEGIKNMAVCSIMRDEMSRAGLSSKHDNFKGQNVACNPNSWLLPVLQTPCNVYYHQHICGLFLVDVAGNT